MAKPWKDVAASPEFQALEPDQQEAARRRYFETVVLPKVPAGKEQAARERFYAATKSAPAALVEEPSVAETLSQPPSMVQQVPRAAIGDRLIGGIKNRAAGMLQFAGHVLPGAGDIRAWADRAAGDTLRESKAMSSSLGYETDVARLLGESAPLMAASLLAGPQPTIGRIAAMGAAQGAVAGAAEPVDVLAEGDYWAPKTGQLASGAVVGGLAAPAVVGVGRGLAAVVQRAIDTTRRVLGPKATSAQFQAGLADNLRGSGVDWSSLSAEAQDVARRSAAEVGIDPRLLDPQQLALRTKAANIPGVALTPGDELRGTGAAGVKRWSAERNLAKIIGGEEMGRRISDNNLALLAGLRDVRSQIPVPLGISPLSADEGAVDAVRGAHAPLATYIRDQYEHAGADALARRPVDVGRLLTMVDEEVNRNGGGVHLDSGVRGRLEALARGRNTNMTPGGAEREFTVRDAENLSTYANARYGVEPDADRRVLAAAIRSIQGAADQDAGGVSPFAYPRAVEATRQLLLDDLPAYRAALSETGSPDRFIEKFALGGNATAQPSVLRTLIPHLDQDAPDAANAIRARALDQILDSAGAGAGGTEGISQNQLTRALESLGEDRLRILFSPEQVQKLLDIRDVAQVVNQLPPGHGVNTSNTATAAANGLMGLAGANGFSALLSSLLRTAGAQNSARRALVPIPLQPAVTTSPLADLLRGSAARAADPLSVLLATGAAETTDR